MMKRVKGVARGIAYFLLSVIGILFIVFLLINTKPVQRLVLGEVTEKLANDLGADIRVGDIDIGFFDSVVLTDVYISDRSKDTLLYSERIAAEFTLNQILDQQILIHEVSTKGTYLNLYRGKDSENFNYNFLIEEFSSEDTTTSPWNVTLDKAALENIRLDYFDYPTGTRINGYLNEALASVSQLGTEGEATIVNEVAIAGLNVKMENNVVPVSQQSSPEMAYAPEEETEQAPWKVLINQISISNSEYILNNHNTEFTKGIDYNHLWVKKINGQLNDISLSDKGYVGSVKDLALIERSGFELNNLTATVKADLPSLQVNLERFATPNSQIEEKLAVLFPNIENLEDNLQNIEAAANLDNSYIATKDVEYFLPGIDTIPQLKGQRVFLAGQVKGELQDISAENLVVTLSETNGLKGDFRLKGILDPKTAHYYADLDYLQTTADFIKEFLQKEPEGVNLDALGTMALEGKVQGELSNLSVNALLKSNAGRVKANMRLAFDEEFNPQTVEGTIRATGAQLGRVLQNQQLGALTATANLQTKGDKIIIPNGNIESFQFNNYTYNNIAFSGTYENEKLQAEINSKDQNLAGTFTTDLNLKGTPSYQLDGDFEKVDLKALNFSENPFVIAGNISGKASGTEIDNIEGQLVANNLYLNNEEYEYQIDSLQVQTQLQNGIRSLTANSGFFNANIEGRFDFSELPAAATHLANHYYSGIESSSEEHLKSLDFTVSLEDTKGLLRLVVPGLQDLQGLKIDGNWEKDTHVLNADLKVDKLVYQETSLYSIKANIRAGEEKLKVEATANQLALTKDITFQQTYVEGELMNDSLLFTTQFTDSASNSHLDLDGILAIGTDTMKLSLPDAQIALKGNEWQLEGNPRLVFSGNYLSINDFLLTAAPNQQILVSSKNLKEQGPSIFTEIKNVHLDELSELAGLGFPVTGTINGTARVTDPMNTPAIHGTLTADSLTAKGQALGNAVVTLEKDQEDPNLAINARLTEGERLLAVDGTVNIEGPENELALKVNADKFALSTIEPFATEFAYELEGTASADLNISGTIQQPAILGQVNLIGRNLIGLEATKTSYVVQDETVQFTNNEIAFDTLQLFDTEGNVANVFGNVYHKELSNFRFDLNLSAEDFLFLNNEEETVLPFYGEIYADMKMQVKGPADSIDVDMNVVAEKKSNIYMSLVVPTSTYATPEFIRFVGGDSVKVDGEIPAEAAKVAKTDTADYSVAFQSFNIEGGLEINKDAVFNLVIDPVNGDKITARGEGDFQFSFDTQNDLNLFGTYTLEEGDYTFTFLNLVKKNFNIVKGSTISWQGDPESGIMDVTASYTTQTSRAPLVQDQTANLQPEELRAARKELPVTVLLSMEGELLNPELTFDIKIPEQSGGIAGSLVAQRLNEIKANSSELNKQVLGLIAFNQFMPYESWDIQGGAGTGAIAAQSVSRVLNSQLSNLTQQIAGVDLDVNVKAGDQLAVDALNVMASKQINDRLSISVGGDVTQRSAANQSGGGGTMFIGDYIIYYRLNEGGNVMLKIFSESDRDLYTDYVQQVSGVSIRHSKTFDKLKNIF